MLQIVSNVVLYNAWIQKYSMFTIRDKEVIYESGKG